MCVFGGIGEGGVVRQREQRLQELQQMTTSVKMSTQQKSDYLMEVNPVQARPAGPSTLEIIVHIC